MKEKSDILYKAHALAFKALDLHNRSYLINLTKDEFKKLENAFLTLRKAILG